MPEKSTPGTMHPRRSRVRLSAYLVTTRSRCWPTWEVDADHRGRPACLSLSSQVKLNLHTAGFCQIWPGFIDHSAVVLTVISTALSRHESCISCHGQSLLLMYTYYGRLIICYWTLLRIQRFNIRDSSFDCIAYMMPLMYATDDIIYLLRLESVLCSTFCISLFG